MKEGASQTFAIAAQEGYAIADVLVDSQSVGAVDSYTFENVTANHTIAAVFTRTASDVQFDNDFESETFPGHGWTVKHPYRQPLYLVQGHQYQAQFHQAGPHRHGLL